MHLIFTYDRNENEEWSNAYSLNVGLGLLIDYKGITASLGCVAADGVIETWVNK